MTEHTVQIVTDHPHYSSVTRDVILTRLLNALQSDKRIIGLLVVGSGAEGFEDIHSDIDLCVVTSLVDDVKPTFQEWGVQISEMFPFSFS